MNDHKAPDGLDILDANLRPNRSHKPSGLTVQLSIAQKQLDSGDDREWAATLRAVMESACLQLAERHHITATDIADIATQLDRTTDAVRPGFFPDVASSIIALRNHQKTGMLPKEWQYDIHARATAILQHHGNLSSI